MLAAGARSNLSPSISPVLEEPEMKNWEAFLADRCPIDGLTPELARARRDWFANRCLELMLAIAASQKHGRAKGSFPAEKKFTVLTPAAFIREYVEMDGKFPTSMLTPEQEQAEAELRRAAEARKEREALELEAQRRTVDLIRARYEELLALEAHPPTTTRKVALRELAATQVRSAQLEESRAGPGELADVDQQLVSQGGSASA